MNAWAASDEKKRPKEIKYNLKPFLKWIVEVKGLLFCSFVFL